MNYLTEVSLKLQQRDGKKRQQHLIEEFVNISQQHCLKPKLQTVDPSDTNIRPWNQSMPQSTNSITNKKGRPMTSRFPARNKYKATPLSTAEFYLDDFAPIQANNHATISIDRRAKQRTQLLKRRGSGYFKNKSHSTIQSKDKQLNIIPTVTKYGLFFQLAKKKTDIISQQQLKQPIKPYCPTVIKQYHSPHKKNKNKKSFIGSKMGNQSTIYTIDYEEAHDLMKRCPMSVSPPKPNRNRRIPIVSGTDLRSYITKTNIKIVV